jgi:hypothetical protein
MAAGRRPRGRRSGRRGPRRRALPDGVRRARTCRSAVLSGRAGEAQSDENDHDDDGEQVSGHGEQRWHQLPQYTGESAQHPEQDDGDDDENEQDDHPGLTGRVAKRFSDVIVYEQARRSYR